MRVTRPGGLVLPWGGGRVVFCCPVPVAFCRSRCWLVLDALSRSLAALDARCCPCCSACPGLSLCCAGCSWGCGGCWWLVGDGVGVWWPGVLVGVLGVVWRFVWWLVSWCPLVVVVAACAAVGEGWRCCM